jgi:hypothetical protein
MDHVIRERLASSIDNGLGPTVAERRRAREAVNDPATTSRQARQQGLGRTPRLFQAASSHKRVHERRKTAFSILTRLFSGLKETHLAQQRQRPCCCSDRKNATLPPQKIFRKNLAATAIFEQSH